MQDRIQLELENYLCYATGQIKFLLSVEKNSSVVNMFSRKKKFMEIDPM
jgi:hypothetical protein